MNIRQATEADQQRWDTFVGKQTASTPYHLFAWTKAVQNAYGFKSFNLIAEENSNQLLGIFPITLLKIPFKRPEFVALPYCDIGSLLASSAEAETALLEEALAIAATCNASAIDIRGDINVVPSKIHGYALQESSNKVRMLLNLPDSSTELWQGFKAKLRSQVRKAEKNGLTFQFANDKIDDFYTVFSTNMRDLGSPVHSKKWFEEIIGQFGGNAKLGLVYDHDKTVGAGITLRAGRTISIPWASTLRTHNHLSPNMLLYWKFLENAADNNCATFDFGRSTPDEGTYHFKRQWGATAKPLTWYSLILDGAAQKTQSKSMNHREMAEKIWQKFPLALANVLGPAIRKYISL
jgi:FemAB-related protein (PEP-CTERM system-associated)